MYDLLRQSILDLTLKPGQLVSAKDLAAAWNVSRTPVRDALNRLAQEGLVVVYAQAGTFVSRIDLDDVEEARFARMTLECAAIEYAFDPSDDDIAELRANVERQRRETENSPAVMWAAMYDLDAQLHRKLIQMGGHRMIWELVRIPLAHMERVRRLIVAHATENEAAADSRCIVDVSEIIREHERIVEAVASRDPVAAREAMADHLSRVSLVGATLAAEWPEYFEEPGHRPDTPPVVVDKEGSGK